MTDSTPMHPLAGTAEKVYAEFTYDQLRSAFETVQDEDHWKNPISAVIPAGQHRLTAAAIEFFAGGGSRVRSIADRDDLFFIEAPGYYNVIGA